MKRRSNHSSVFIRRLEDKENVGVMRKCTLVTNFMYIYGWLFTSGVLFSNEIHRWSIVFIKTSHNKTKRRPMLCILAFEFSAWFLWYHNIFDFINPWRMTQMKVLTLVISERPCNFKHDNQMTKYISTPSSCQPHPFTVLFFHWTCHIKSSSILITFLLLVCPTPTIRFNLTNLAFHILQPLCSSFSQTCNPSTSLL